MPLAYGASLGGIMTLVGTPPNLIVKATLDDVGLVSFGFFDFAMIGVPIFLVGMLYMVTAGRHLLPMNSMSRNGTNEVPTTARTIREGDAPASRGKQRAAGCTLAMFAVLVGGGWLPLSVVAVACALTMVILRCVTFE